MKNSIIKMLSLIVTASLILSGCGNTRATTDTGSMSANTEASVESTVAPTEAPKATATAEVTEAPAATDVPEATTAPTVNPESSATTAPSEAPKVTEAPTVTAAPTAKPTEAPKPTQAPTAVPTAEPTAAPTVVPTAEPTAAPTEVPTPEPVVEPEPEPTAAPTEAPAPQPTPSYQVSQNIEPDERDNNDICATCNHQMIESWANYPTCVSNGWVNYICQLCYYTDPEWSGSVPATGHTPEAYVAHVGDCVDPTIIRYRCSVCGSNNVQDEEEVPTENPEHDWQTGMALVGFDPNTGDPIYKEMTGCGRCGMKLDE